MLKETARFNVHNIKPSIFSFSLMLLQLYIFLLKRHTTAFVISTSNVPTEWITENVKLFSTQPTVRKENITKRGSNSENDAHRKMAVKKRADWGKERKVPARDQGNVLDEDDNMFIKYSDNFPGLLFGVLFTNVFYWRRTFFVRSFPRFNSKITFTHIQRGEESAHRINKENNERTPASCSTPTFSVRHHINWAKWPTYLILLFSFHVFWFGMKNGEPKT